MQESRADKPERDAGKLGDTVEALEDYANEKQPFAQTHSVNPIYVQVFCNGDALLRIRRIFINRPNQVLAK